MDSQHDQHKLAYLDGQAHAKEVTSPAHRARNLKPPAKMGIKDCTIQAETGCTHGNIWKKLTKGSRTNVMGKCYLPMI